jgi:hypothetical protein
MPSISLAYGLFIGDFLEGVVTYGTPPSAPQRDGLAGKEFAKHTLELNRLVLMRNFKNDASFLISKSLRLLNRNAIIISYADTEQNHNGIVYQASNFTYHGLSAKRTNWTVRGKENLHGLTIADEFKGYKNRSVWMKMKYGDNFYLRERPRKHRYIKLIGTKGFRAKAAKALKYKQESYPK